MNNSVAKIGNSKNSALNILKSFGQFLISQSEIVSDSYVKHKIKLASVEIGKELIINKATELNDVEKRLLVKLTECDNPEERISIKRDIEYIEGKLRQLKIGEQAFSYLILEPPDDKKVEEKPTPEITPHWIDKFNELARVRNEPWREDLLAKALAKEASSPGSVMPRTLWLIGMLEEHLFNAVASLLDIAADLDGDLIIPTVSKDIWNKPIPDCNLGEKIQIGNLAYMLEDIGVLADFSSAMMKFFKKSNFIVEYFKHKYRIECKDHELSVPGTMLTGIGKSIAIFYDRKFNKLGEEIFLKWIDSLDKSKFTITKIADCDK